MRMLSRNYYSIEDLELTARKLMRGENFQMNKSIIISIDCLWWWERWFKRGKCVKAYPEIFFPMWFQGDNWLKVSGTEMGE